MPSTKMLKSTVKKPKEQKVKPTVTLDFLDKLKWNEDPVGYQRRLRDGK